jgi:hypothetical protein
MVFIRCKEDFTCSVCGQMNKGDGYTNHCSVCLHSKHVDNNPGDRLSTCDGIMKPIAYEKKGKGERILHRCIICNMQKWNKVRGEDERHSLEKLCRA